MEESETPPHSPRQKTIKLITPQTTKTTNVKDQMLVAISKDTPENEKAVLDLIQV